jgi:hypothetical protein
MFDHQNRKSFHTDSTKWNGGLFLIFSTLVSCFICMLYWRVLSFGTLHNRVVWRRWKEHNTSIFKVKSKQLWTNLSNHQRCLMMAVISSWALEETWCQGWPTDHQFLMLPAFCMATYALLTLHLWRQHQYIHPKSWRTSIGLRGAMC